MGLWQSFMEYDPVQRLLYGAAFLFTLWFAAAWLLRRGRKLDRRHWFHEWGETLFSAVWLALLIRGLLLELYSIPSESMVPTLLISDHLVVGKLSFGWPKPFGRGRILKFRDVKRGEIVIFVPPHKPKLAYVKRCVGLPGDRIEIREKRVFINGLPAEVPSSYGVLAWVAPASQPLLSAERAGYLNRRLPQLAAAGEGAGAEALRTTWQGPFRVDACTYYIESAASFARVYGRLLDADSCGRQDVEPRGGLPEREQGIQPNWSRERGLGNRDWFGPYTLGPGEYWMMGDNRDNSSDSRYFGPVREEALRGTPLFRYWPLDRIGLVR